MFGLEAPKRGQYPEKVKEDTKCGGGVAQKRRTLQNSRGRMGFEVCNREKRNTMVTLG